VIPKEHAHGDNLKTQTFKTITHCFYSRTSICFT